MKKLLSLLAIAVLFVSLLVSVSLFATTGASNVHSSNEASNVHSSNEWEYEINNDKATITKYTGTNSQITIPATLDGYVVTAIGERAFRRCNTIENLVIADGITTIGKLSFAECTKLTNIDIPDSVVTVESYAFSGCANLLSVTIGNAVANIDSYAFQNCDHLVSVDLGNSVIVIGEGTFDGCEALTDIIIPDSVTSIGNYAFYNCRNLTTVTIGEYVTDIGEYAFCFCKKLSSIIIGGKVSNVGANAFGWCTNLTDIYYKGTEVDRVTISVGENNHRLADATWHYNYQSPPSDADNALAPDNDRSLVLLGDEGSCGSSVSENVDGLAFLFNARVCDSEVENGNEYVANSASVVPYMGGESYPVVRMGAVVSNQSDAILDMEHVDGECVINVEAVHLWDWREDAVSFAIRIINIPDHGKDTIVTVRPYYVYEADSEEVVVYGDAVSNSYNAALNG